MDALRPTFRPIGDAAPAHVPAEACKRFSISFFIKLNSNVVLYQDLTRTPIMHAIDSNTGTGTGTAKPSSKRASPFANTFVARTLPLSTIIAELDVPRVIDYLSLDIEGAELMAMRTFPWSTHRIKVITVERPEQKLCELFTTHGYVM